MNSLQKVYELHRLLKLFGVVGGNFVSGFRDSIA
jgi:hypothetical protein